MTKLMLATALLAALSVPAAASVSKIPTKLEYHHGNYLAGNPGFVRLEHEAGTLRNNAGVCGLSMRELRLQLRGRLIASQRWSQLNRADAMDKATAG